MKTLLSIILSVCLIFTSSIGFVLADPLSDIEKSLDELVGSDTIKIADKTAVLDLLKENIDEYVDVKDVYKAHFDSKNPFESLKQEQMYKALATCIDRAVELELFSNSLASSLKISMDSITLGSRKSYKNAKLDESLVNTLNSLDKDETGIILYAILKELYSSNMIDRKGYDALKNTIRTLIAMSGI